MSAKMGDEIDEGTFSLNLSSIDSETHLVDLQRTPSVQHDDVFKCSISSSGTLVPSGQIHSDSNETNLIKSDVSTVPYLPTNILPDLDYLLEGPDEESSQQQGQVIYNRTIDDDVSIDGIEDDWGDEENARAVSALQRAYQCMDEKCPDSQCTAYQFIMKSIEEDLCSGNVSYSSRKLLESIIKHNECCDEISCTVPWCSFFHIDGNKTVASLMRLYKQVDLEEDFLSSVSPDAEFFKLTDSVDWPSGYKQPEVSNPTELRPGLGTYPQSNVHLNEPRLPLDARNQLHGPISSEIVDRRTNALMPRSGIDYLHEIQSVSFGQRSVTCVSTTIPTLWLSFTQCAMAGHNKEVWQELRNLDCENIQKLLWICVDRAVVTICNKFNFETNLDTVIAKVLPHGSIHGSEILKYTLGLVNAVRYLTNIHICYLYWTASSIKMNENYTKALLSDFSLSISIRDASEAEGSDSEDSESEDSDSEGSEDVIDFIMPSLPPHILTPEIFTGKIGSMTDVWGIGCIMYHMSTGFCVHHQHRHEDSETMRETVENCNPRDLLPAVRDSLIREILSKIFTEHTSRIKLEDLDVLINQKLQEFEREVEEERRRRGW